MIDFSHFGPGEHRLPCPHCAKNPRDKSLGLTMKADGSAVAHCFRCSFVETHHPKDGVHVTAPSKPLIQGRQQAPQHTTLSDYGCHLWGRCKPIAGDALDYLSARRCRIPPSDSDLKWHPALKHPSGYIGPALVARVTDILTGEAISLHRTWIRPDGRKAYVGVSRMLFGGHRKQGGCIRLWPVGDATSCLGIAEGIETALSLAWAVQSCWSLIDAGNLKAFPVLPNVNTLVIAKDNDDAGIKAANECGSRWLASGRKVLVSNQTQNDLNDAVNDGVAA